VRDATDDADSTMTTPITLRTAITASNNITLDDRSAVVAPVVVFAGGRLPLRTTRSGLTAVMPTPPATT
jgi:hypothetical protein